MSTVTFEHFQNNFFSRKVPVFPGCYYYHPNLLKNKLKDTMKVILPILRLRMCSSNGCSLI